MASRGGIPYILVEYFIAGVSGVLFLVLCGVCSDLVEGWRGGGCYGEGNHLDMSFVHFNHCN